MWPHAVIIDASTRGTQVKIMWPRGDLGNGPGGDMTASRRNRNAGLSGFVSFMKRKHAESALRDLDGFDWGGSVLRVGWSKAVPMSNKPLYSKPLMALSSLFFDNSVISRPGSFPFPFPFSLPLPLTVTITKPKASQERAQ